MGAGRSPTSGGAAPPGGRSGEARHAAAPDCMAEITARLDGRDVEAVAAWLAARPVPDNTEPADTPIAEPPMDCGSVPAPDDNA